MDWAEYWYNTSHHNSISCTPFKALYGRDPPTLICFEQGSTANSSLEEQLQERDAILDDLKAHLLRAQQIMKHQADVKRRDMEFAVGDLVFLKLQPYRQKSVVTRLHEKLAARYFGPFKVLERIGKVAYKLSLPPEAKIHPVFHISQLKKAIGSAPVCPTIPAQLTKDMIMVAEPEEILGVRNASIGGAMTAEVLVKWKGLPDFEATWEDYASLDLRFPDFHLEDKVAFWVGGNASTQLGQPNKPPVLFTYTRKRAAKN